MSAKREDQGWDRTTFNVRLTAARRRRLKAVAAGLSGSPTPMQALDAALELALRPRSGDGVSEERIDELDDSLAARIMALEGAFWDQREESAGTRKSLEDLRALISGLAGDEGHERSLAAPAAPEGFRGWIGQELAARGLGSAREAIVRATWRATAAKSARLVAVDFEAALMSVDGKPARIVAGLMGAVRFEVEPASELASAWRFGPLALRCVAQGSGWKLEIRAAGQDGKASRLVASLDA